MMTDLFGSLASQVLGTASEVVPLLPPLFAPDSGYPPLTVTPEPQALNGELEQTRAEPFPPPLVTYTKTADAPPLPTLRQMRQIRPVPLAPVPVTQDGPKSTDANPDALEQAVARSIPTAVEQALPGMLQTASPPERAADHTPLPRPPPAPASLQVESSGVVPQAAAAVPRIIRAASPPGISVGTDGQLGEISTSPAATPPEHSIGQPLPDIHPVEHAPAQAVPVARGSQSIQPPAEPVELLNVPVTAEPVRSEPLAAAGGVRTEAAPGPHPFGEQAPAPPAAQPAATVIQRQAVPDGAPSMPLAPPPIPAAGADLPISTQVISPPVMAASDLAMPGIPAPAAPGPAIGLPGMVVPGAAAEARMHQMTAPGIAVPDAALLGVPAPELAGSAVVDTFQEPARSTDRALPRSSEPVIVPAPEPLSVESNAVRGIQTPGFEQPPGEQASVGKPEPLPVVRVTIGRVIVRAALTEENPSSPRVELPKPPLSLEAYLQSRKRGEQ